MITRELNQGEKSILSFIIFFAHIEHNRSSKRVIQFWEKDPNGDPEMEKMIFQNVVPLLLEIGFEVEEEGNNYFIKWDKLPDFSKLTFS